MKGFSRLKEFKENSIGLIKNLFKFLNPMRSVPSLASARRGELRNLSAAVRIIFALIILVSLPLYTIYTILFSISEIPGILKSGLKDLASLASKAFTAGKQLFTGKKKSAENQAEDCKSMEMAVEPQQKTQSIASWMYDKLPNRPSFLTSFSCVKKNKVDDAEAGNASAPSRNSTYSPVDV